MRYRKLCQITSKTASCHQSNGSNMFLFAFMIFPSCVLSTVSGTITVISQLTNESVYEFADAPASFVPDRVSYYGLRGYAVYADPPNACVGLQPPPNTTTVVNWILVAKRLDCDFQTKIENAQSMGYSAIIIHNVGSNRTEPMTVRDPERLMIYAAFIGEYNGELIRDNYSIGASNYRYFLEISDDFSLNGYILPFAIVVSICFVVMLLFMVRLLWQQVSRWLRERRRSRRRKLPTSVLKKLPITKWTKGDPYETCAVCLEDFVEQDKVRVLPCSHGFHAVCIDPWLTKNRRVCPICKRKVILAEERFNDSDSDSDDETTPLLRNVLSSAPNLATSSSTFIQQGDSLFRGQRRPFNNGRRPPRRSTTSTGSSDSSSISSSGSQGETSHRSLPVLAEVHGLGQSTELPPGTRAPFPSLQTQPSSMLNSRSSSFHRDLCDEVPEVSSIVPTHGFFGTSTPQQNIAINLDPVDIVRNDSPSSIDSESLPAVEVETSDLTTVHVPHSTSSTRNQDAIV